MYDILELNKKLLPELRDIAKELKIKRVEALRKQDLIYKILDQQAIVASEVKQKPKEIKKDRPTPDIKSESPRRRGRKPAPAKEEPTTVKASVKVEAGERKLDPEKLRMLADMLDGCDSDDEKDAVNKVAQRMFG